jgi:hypothetical protein
VIDAFDQAVPLHSSIEDLPIRTVSVGDELRFPVSTARIKERIIETGRNPRHVVTPRSLPGCPPEELTLEEMFLFLCAQPHLSMAKPPRKRGHQRFIGSMNLGCNKCRAGHGCNLRIRWTNTGAPFTVQVHRSCLCCLAGRSPMPSSPCHNFNVFLVKVDNLDCTLPNDHPARKLATYLSRDHRDLPLSGSQFLKTFASPRTQYRSRVMAAHCQDLDALINSLTGYVLLQTVNPMHASRYPLSSQGQEIVTFTWVAPWVRTILNSGLIQYFELDASFYAIRPYAYIIPFAVIANDGIPLGLVISPTEREESDRLFDDALLLFGMGPGLVARGPILSDQRAALNAYCRIRYLCCDACAPVIFHES